MTALSHAGASVEHQTPCSCSQAAPHPLRRNSSNRTHTLNCAPHAVSGKAESDPHAKRFMSRCSTRMPRTYVRTCVMVGCASSQMGRAVSTWSPQRAAAGRQSTTCPCYHVRARGRSRPRNFKFELTPDQTVAGALRKIREVKNHT